MSMLNNLKLRCNGERSSFPNAHRIQEWTF